MIPMARNLKKLVFDNANEDDLRQASLKNGMETLREADSQEQEMEPQLLKKY